MVKLFSFFFVVIFSSSLFAKKGKSIFDKVELRSGMNIDVVEAQDLRARIFGYEIRVLIEDKINSDLTLFFDASAFLEKGSNDVTGGVAEFEPNENINLNSGGISYNPIELLSFRAGALSQADHNSPLLVDASAFTGVEERINLGPFYFKATQSIPNNTRLIQRIGATVESGTPFFGMETLGVKYGKREYLKLEISHFQYKDLSSNIAETSRLFGNSTSGTGQTTDFLYGFDGVNALLETKYSFWGLNTLLSAQYLYNDKAPEGRNKGYLGHLEIGGKTHFLVLEGFKNESDTSPAFYNSKYYGHNNYQGSGLGYIMRGKSLQLSMQYYDLNLIEENSIQEDTEIFRMSFFKNYFF